MAIPVKIEDLIHARTVESTRIEYKKDFNPDAIIRTICAFANDIDNIGGGYILIGVEEENGSPRYPLYGVPQGQIDGILKKLRQYCHAIEPLYEPVVEPVQVFDKEDGQDKYLIVIWVSGGYGRPYTAPEKVTVKDARRHFYIRKFSSTSIASREEEKELFYVSSNTPFDDRINLLAEVSDLDRWLMTSFLKEIGSYLEKDAESMSTLELAESMHLVAGPPEDLRPLNVATLMFSMHPEKFFRYARIEVVDMPDPTGTNMEERVFEGPLHIQLREALRFIRNYVIKEKVVKHDDREEATRFYNYPYSAVEELLANAVYHRSYQIPEPITVVITPKGMEITSFPGLHSSITEEDIASFHIQAKFYRNRRIGDFLKELRLIEGRNTGYPKALAALKHNGSSPPILKMDKERGYLSVTIPVHPNFAPKGKKVEKNNLYEERIKEALQAEPLTLSDVSRSLGYKSISKKLSTKVKELSERKEIGTEVKDGSIRYFSIDD